MIGWKGKEVSSGKFKLNLRLSAWKRRDGRGDEVKRFNVRPVRKIVIYPEHNYNSFNFSFP